jgi:predicted ATPase/DNA-binding winged helix-turn-helix (wHTH) protein
LADASHQSPVLSDERSYRFGAYQLFPRTRVLLADGRPVRLGSRAIDILTALIERAGEVVSKDELIARAWPNTFVDETNLRVHIGALRKALGDGQQGRRYLTNVVNRGYSFIVPITIEEGKSKAHFGLSQQQLHNLPPFLSALIGRTEVVNSLTSHIGERRLVTVVGSPGIGKTSVALSVAHALVESYDQQVRFIDLASISNAAFLESAVTSSLGLSGLSQDSAAGIISFLRDKRMLLVLDNCEHVIEAAAKFSEAVLKGAPQVRLLATSREPLRAEGEWVQRLAPLEVPPASGMQSAGQVLKFPAVTLFIARATASLDTFKLTEAEAPIIADICRRLDGIPLAIELAAARVGTFGVRQIASLLEDRFVLLTRGRRTALPRQQTLIAALDWSYNLLSEDEKTVFARVGVFAGSFSMIAAKAVAASQDIGVAQVFDCLDNLSAKSLVTVDVINDRIDYRLLEMTRSYALDKLRSSKERNAIARHHAEHFCELLRKAETDFEAQALTDWIDANARNIDDIRLALDWAFSKEGDAKLGAELCASAASLFLQLSLSHELRAQLERALKSLLLLASIDPALEMNLNLALGMALYNTEGPTPAVATASTRALTLAQRCGSGSHQLRALWALARESYARGDYENALRFVERFGSVARSIPDDVALLIYARMMSLALHLLGRHAESRIYAEQAMAPTANAVSVGYENFYQYDYGVVARSHLSRILWVQGFPDQALKVSQEALSAASSLDNVISLCNALVLAACPIALWSGDIIAAKQHVSDLLPRSARHSLGYMHYWGRLYEYAISLIENGHITDQPSAPSKLVSTLHIDLLGTLHERLAGPLALSRAENGLSEWSAPEIFRANGTQLLNGGSSDSQKRAEIMFVRSLDLARQQNALSWELRASTSLASLWRDSGRRSQASDLLAGILARFTEGFGTRDLIMARALLSELDH